MPTCLLQGLLHTHLIPAGFAHMNGVHSSTHAMFSCLLGAQVLQKQKIFLLGSHELSFDITQKTICPGLSSFTPSSRLRYFAPGGKMLETYTRLQYAIPASRNASSKEPSWVLDLPTPLVRNTFFGTIFIELMAIFLGVFL